MPTGAHFTKRIYDDLVTWDTTRTSEQINKTREGFELSHNLGVTTGGEARIIGTRYDYNDLYSEIIKSGDWHVRIHAADKDPKYWDEETLAKKKRLMGSYTFATQISLEPLSESEQKFNITWIKWFQQPPDRLNKYLIVDPANEKKGDSSYTVMWVVGAHSSKNIHVLDIVRDKLNLTERWKKLRDLKAKHPDLITVGYEKYSMQADITFMQLKMAEEKQYFNIIPLGGMMSKDDRIRGLIPYFESGKMWMPREYWYTDVEGKQRDLIKEFLEDEYMFFPAISKKDMLDALARITSPDLG
jgi:phage terminase large subunit-like protein